MQVAKKHFSTYLLETLGMVDSPLFWYIDPVFAISFGVLEIKKKKWKIFYREEKSIPNISFLNLTTVKAKNFKQRTLSKKLQ